jgi:hemolysin activation/secretion protein/AraC-like DNA-binding protein
MCLASHLVLSEITIQAGAEWRFQESGWRLARLTMGAGFWLDKGDIQEVGPGQTLVIPQKTSGSFHASQLAAVKIQFFRWRPDLLDGILSLSERRYFAAAEEDKTAAVRILPRDAVAEHFDLLAKASPGEPSLITRLKLLQLIGEVFGAEIARQKFPGSGNAPSAAERFQRLIGGLTEPEILDFTPVELARRCGCSLRHFSRLFHARFGTSVRARQTELRLQKASLLLLDTNHKIIDVAMDSGYRHLGLFNNLFKKHIGMTPSQWRAKKKSPRPARHRQTALFSVLMLLWFSLAAAWAAEPAGFKVSRYDVVGNTVLETNLLDKTLVPYTGEHVTLDQIRKGLTQLQLAYRDRGFVTVKVGLPQQRLTNGIVRVQVIEGRLAEIIVVKNHYFSSNNVMRSLPGLHTNMLLNSLVFQQELDRANANRDRQIYPEIAPGPEPGTSALRLKVVDRLPLHARLDYNNESTPGTPDTRAGLSLVDDNLWQLDHQLGLQYLLSPEDMKSTALETPDFFDEPRVAAYSGYYRMPIPFLQGEANPPPLTSANFGYDEVNKRFRPPPTEGPPELIVYASRGATDTGISLTQSETPLGTNGGFQEVDTRGAETITFNEDLGYRLSKSLPAFFGVNHSISFGTDYKAFRQFSINTRTSTGTFYIKPGQPSGPPQTLYSFTNNPSSVNYLPFTLNWDGSRADKWGLTSLFLYQSINFTSLSASDADRFATVAQTSTANADGNFYILNAGATREQKLYHDWAMTLKASGQWASQTLIGNEQFGLGGLPGPRGYREGDEYGDAGWRVSAEPHTPTYNITMINDTMPVRLNGSVFMDFGQRFDYSVKFTNPNGVPLSLADQVPTVSLWGAGVALNGMIGKIYEFHFALGVPLLSTPDTSAGAARLYFALSAQF